MNRSAELQLGAACPERADLEIGAPSTRFMAPMRARIGVVATHAERAPSSARCAVPECVLEIDSQESGSEVAF